MNFQVIFLYIFLLVHPLLKKMKEGMHVEDGMERIYYLFFHFNIVSSPIKRENYSFFSSCHCLRLHNSLNEWILTFVLLKLETIIESPF